jgi:hypothetical protein
MKIDRSGIGVTLSEELAGLGIKGSVDEVLALAGKPLSEDAVRTTGIRSVESLNAAPTALTHEILQRVEQLDVETLKLEDVENILKELSGLDVDEKDTKLVEHAQQIVTMLINTKRGLEEGATFKTFAAHGTKKVVKHKQYGQKARKARRMAKIFRRKNKARIALKSRKRELKGWFKRVTKLREAKQPNHVHAVNKAIVGSRHLPGIAASADSEIANDLRSVLSEARASRSLRNQIVEQFATVFDLIDELYNSEKVGAVIDEAFQPIDDRDQAGTLTEESLDDDEFMEMLSPCISLVGRVLESVEAGKVDFEFIELTEDDENDDEDDEEDLGNVRDLG